MKCQNVVKSCSCETVWVTVWGLYVLFIVDTQRSIEFGLCVFVADGERNIQKCALSEIMQVFNFV